MIPLRHLIVAIVLASVPFGAAAETCDTGSSAAKPLALTISDADSGQALAMSIIIGMTHEMKNHHLGLKVGDPRCEAASIAMGTTRFALRADNTSAWPRVAGDNYQAILATTLKPAGASRLITGWYVSRTAGASSNSRVDPAQVIYMLAGRTSDRHVWAIYGFYDGIPDTTKLAQMMCQAAIGSLPVAARFEAKFQNVTFDDVSALASFADRDPATGPCTVGPPS